MTTHTGQAIRRMRRPPAIIILAGMTWIILSGIWNTISDDGAASSRTENHEHGTILFGDRE